MLAFTSIEMKKVFLFFLLAAIFQTSFGQFPGGTMQTPIFASKTDSTEYANIISAMFKIMGSADWQKGIRSFPVEKTLDSLRLSAARFTTKIIGYRLTYKSVAKFTTYEDLKNGKVKPDSVIQLSFANSKLKSLPPEIYQCKNLQEMELVNTSIEKLPRRLNKLSNLKSIYVYNNKIPKHLNLRRNKRIQTLLIRGVRAENLPITYKRFIKLDTLDLSRNIGVTAFPDIYKNRQLKKLDLFENNLTLKDLKPIQNKSLQNLNLIKNRITDVPDAISIFAALRKLTFSNNQISYVTPGLSKLKNLESLSFYQNKLESIPSSIYDMPNLRELDLYFNQIKTIDPGITKLQNLRTLYLSNNKLASLPDNIGELSNLQGFYLHNNRLSDLPVSIQKMQSLKILRINNNLFTLFPTPVLALSNLENLDVSQNMLHDFPTELSNLTKLQILVLGGNPWENKDVLVHTAQILEINGTIVHGK